MQITELRNNAEQSPSPAMRFCGSDFRVPISMMQPVENKPGSYSVIAVSFENIRQQCLKFGSEYARTLKQAQGRLGDIVHLRADSSVIIQV